MYLFIQTISIAPLQVQYYSEALPKQHGYCAGVSRRSARSNSELSKNLPKVPTWRVERDSKQQPGRKASTLKMRHRVPQLH